MTRRRSKDGRGAEAIARDDAETWRVHEIHEGVAELDEGRSVPHAAVVTWLGSCGLRRERQAPRA